MSIKISSCIFVSHLYSSHCCKCLSRHRRHPSKIFKISTYAPNLCTFRITIFSQVSFQTSMTSLIAPQKSKNWTLSQNFCIRKPLSWHRKHCRKVRAIYCRKFRSRHRRHLYIQNLNPYIENFGSFQTSKSSLYSNSFQTSKTSLTHTQNCQVYIKLLNLVSKVLHHLLKFLQYLSLHVFHCVSSIH